MTNFKRFILFYFIGLVLFFAVSVIFGGQLISILKNIGLWILPAIFSLLGFLIGAGVYELMLRPIKKKDNVFLISHSISILFFITLAVSLQYKDWNHKRNYANTEKNHDVMKYFVNDNEEYIRIAFTKLESEFKNPNNFKLDAFSVRKQDTTINGTQDTVYNIYFTYFLDNDKGNKYFSKVSVLSGTPTLQLYNLDTKTNEEYLKIKTEKDKMERETFQSIKESFEQMPDSTRKAIVDTIKKVLSD
jgi:hypothetical protein